MNPVVLNLVLMLTFTQVAKRLDLEDEKTINIIRGCYIASNVIIFLLYAYTRHIINKKKDLTTLKYQTSPSPFSQEEPSLITTTVHAYDLEQVQQALKGVLQGLGMMGFMHLYLKYTQPLIMQSIMPLKSALDNKVVQIHLLGRKAEGDLVRPFKAPSLFGDASQPDEKQMKAAEKSGKGGKEE